jgi:hypothetical protein
LLLVLLLKQRHLSHVMHHRIVAHHRVLLGHHAVHGDSVRFTLPLLVMHVMQLLLLHGSHMKMLLSQCRGGRDGGGHWLSHHRHGACWRCRL